MELTAEPTLHNGKEAVFLTIGDKSLIAPATDALKNIRDAAQDAREQLHHWGRMEEAARLEFLALIDYGEEGDEAHARLKLASGNCARLREVLAEFDKLAETVRTIAASNYAETLKAQVEASRTLATAPLPRVIPFTPRGTRAQSGEPTC